MRRLRKRTNWTRGRSKKNWLPPNWSNWRKGKGLWPAVIFAERRKATRNSSSPIPDKSWGSSDCSPRTTPNPSSNSMPRMRKISCGGPKFKSSEERSRRKRLLRGVKVIRSSWKRIEWSGLSLCSVALVFCSGHSAYALSLPPSASPIDWWVFGSISPVFVGRLSPLSRPTSALGTIAPVRAGSIVPWRKKPLLGGRL